MWNRIKKNLKKFSRKSSDLKGTLSYSQCGEDLIINYLLEWAKIDRISFLDIGAFDPIKINNTYLFYLKGSYGINVDGNIDSIKKFDIVRGKDLNLNRFVSNKIENKTFYIFNSPTLNTLDESAVEDVLKNQSYRLVDQIKVKTTTINDIWRDYGKSKNLDLLSLDVEGMDEVILKNIDFDFLSPKIICTETVSFNEVNFGEKNDIIINFLKSNNYLHYADTFVNSIFVNKDLLG